METKRLLHALGICAKARALVCGTPMVCEALKGNSRPRLVIEASDNSENTAKRLADRCAFYGVELWRVAIDGETLARAIGKSGRVAAVAVSDENLCKLLQGTREKTHS
jgi:ribosomal protein L7Ae-like RNA K-turn-binding protein